MPATMALCVLTAVFWVAGTVDALAQDVEADGAPRTEAEAGPEGESEAKTRAERMEEADQKTRELQEPAPEGVELELTSPTTTESEVEWKDTEQPAKEEETEEEDEEDDRETFGDRFKRGDLFGFFDAQGRFFPQSATSPVPGPVQNNYWFDGSLAWEPGFFMNITDNMNFELILFGRVDQHDSNRTHGDIREGFFELFFDEWTFGFGIHKVFWGVTESRHLVDIINQTDLVEDFDTDIKLGQAMVTSSYTNDKAGTFSLYVMSWARPLVFPGPQGRPTLPIPVDNGLRTYESKLEQGQIDTAFRWSHAMGGFDWGLSYFFGTARDPQLFPVFDIAGNPIALQPYYALINQGGLDAQYTIEGWLLKVEAIVRGGQGPTFAAVTGGFEYTFYQAKGSIVDVGVILEYDYDGRDNNTFILFNNDFFTGLRLSLSDVGSTEFLIGSFIDVKDGSVFIAAEAARRFGDNWKILLEGRGYIPQSGNVLEAFRHDSQIQVDIEYHY